MKEKSAPNIAFYYSKHDMPGRSIYDGNQCATIEVNRLIGEEGLAYIHKFFDNFLYYKKLVHTTWYNKDFGFSEKEYFFHIPSKRLIVVKDPFMLGSSAKAKLEKERKALPSKRADILVENIKHEFFTDKLIDPEIMKEKNFYWIDTSLGESSYLKDKSNLNRAISQAEHTRNIVNMMLGTHLA